MTNPVGPPGRDLPAYDDLPVIEQAGVPKRAPRKTRGCAPASRKAGAQQGV